MATVDTVQGMSSLDLGKEAVCTLEVNNNNKEEVQTPVVSEAEGPDSTPCSVETLKNTSFGTGTQESSAVGMTPTPHETASAKTPANETNNNASEKTVSDTEDNSQNEVAIPKQVPLEEPELHELQTEWSLWLYTNNKSRRWEENLQHVISFKTVEEFWAVYNHIQLSSRLSPGHDYAIFRAGMRPAWEDEANKEGGRWMISLPAKHHRQKDLDRLWLELMLLIIGEDFQNPEESQLVNGAVVSIRFKDDRIALWTGDCKQGPHQMAIGKQIKSRLNINSSLSFESHASQGNSKSKHKPAMYTV